MNTIDVSSLQHVAEIVVPLFVQGMMILWTGMKVMLRIERRLMKIELKLKIRSEDDEI